MTDKRRQPSLFPILKGFSTETVYKWGSQHSPLPGVSGIFYLLPVVPVWLQGRPWEAAVWILQTVATGFSDGVYPGRSSLWHPVDRMVATTGVILNCTKWLWLCNCTQRCRHFSLMAIPLVLLCFYRSKRSQEFDQFVFYHTCWHFLGGLLCMVAALLEESACLPSAI